MAEVQSQRDDKMAMFQAAKMAELREMEEARRKEDFRKRVVEEARRKLLEEHAAVLVRPHPHRLTCLPNSSPGPLFTGAHFATPHRSVVICPVV